MAGTTTTSVLPAVFLQHLTTMQEAMSDQYASMMGRIDQLSNQVDGLDAGLASLVPLLTHLVEVLEKQPKEKSAPKVASYIELYPELRQAPPGPAGAHIPGTRPSSPWTRLFTKKDTRRE